MIKLTRLNGGKYYVNPGLIEIIEAIPDTLVTMTNGKKHYVRESADEVAARIEAYRVRVLSRSRGELNLCEDAPSAVEHTDALEE